MTLLTGRLEEIANEATEYCKTQPREIAGFMWEKKFAELIIKECSKVIKNGGYWSGGPVGERKQCTPPEIAKMIEEHFGIES